MQNADMAAALGISPQYVYTITFGVGAALTGLAGAALAPVSGLLPTMGAAFIAKAFITVIGGGEAIVTGTSSAAALFGTVNQVTTFLWTPVMGDVALLIAAVILLRLPAAGHHRPLLPPMALNVSLNAEGLTVGRLSPALTGPIALVVAIALVIAILPLVISDIFILLQLTLFMAYAILAMSLGWVWAMAASSVSARPRSTASAATPTPWSPSTWGAARARSPPASPCLPAPPSSSAT